MTRLIVGNWKMNLGPHEAQILVKRIEQKLEPHPGVEVVVCPPFIDLVPVAKELDRKKLKLGAQNIHHLDDGPYTGEIGAAMLKGLADYVLVGHSERRAMGESDKVIAQKLAAAVRNGLIPILCVGENLDDREHGLAQKVVVDQLTANLSMLTSAEVSGIVIAYEPVWAINHHDGKKPKPATPEEIRFAYRAVRNTLEELYGEEGSVGVRLLYGGSTNAENARAYLDMDYVDGLLTGTSSLNYETFAQMVAIAQKLD